ncbi:uncharacterized protein F4822DRAFT_444565 [Hypoxylon trugodes]|uniref:uncharacterized protein n=1 Tax=Hypoxylon trugodes TaxID=326681 RepID=UPI00219C5402|nr:uncharacterized protein F4822DRAFT_444565 [Hypoxylon trugodes]KAI1388125.1 hypothetical protein F4822DRAFT_444565 [Hypoxylon trugodes]
MERIIKAIYGGPLPQQKRTEPMQVLCVGISRSGTESLREALLRLGYVHTYHGWDTLLPPRFQLEAWYYLVKRKAEQPDTKFTAADFDPIIGHCVALTDLQGAVFAPELIEAYPDAKVILNVRKDVDAWYRSFNSTMGMFDKDTINLDWLLGWFCSDLFWIRQCMTRMEIPFFFWGSFAKNGKQVYRDHSESVKKMGLPADRFLEWSVEDGWEPLCKFLGKPVPQEPFPAGNTPKDYHKRLTNLMIRYYATAAANLLLTIGAGVGMVAYGIKWYGSN